jgi:putative salt-induced outer membrane protein YdiY
MKYLLAITLLFWLAPDANCAEFHLQDGTVVIGTIVSLIDGEDLVVDTEFMDEVTIEWDAIVSMRGTQTVEVELFNGRRILGIIEVSFGGGVGYDGTDFETSINATTIINEQTSSEDTRRVTLNANYAYKFGSGWQAIGFYQFESDEQQSLDGRSLYGGAIARRILNKRRHRVEFYGGLAVNSESFADTPRNETLEGIVGVRYRMRWAADADLTFAAFPNLEESDRLRTQFDGSLSFDLFSDLDFKITVYNRYDSQPPPGNEKNDTGVTLGLSWEY